MTEFYLVRHGEPDWELAVSKAANIAQHDFAPLTEKGIHQAESAAENPLITRAEIIISSPYTRALQTAAIISRRNDIPLIVEYDLHERLPDTSATAADVNEILELCRDYERCGGVWPEGERKRWEPRHILKERISTVIKKYLSYSRVIVVCHEMVIRSQIETEDVPYASILTMHC